MSETRKPWKVLDAERLAQRRIDNAVRRLARIVKTYESDTFSASGCALTDAQAMVITARLINQIKDHLDGIAIKEVK